MKIKAHIVSHSHWDREWYMQFEQYHMKLIDLIDDVLHQVETDSNFHSFHLDGQMIIINDYLKVRPENEYRLNEAISCGKIKVGPWYVAQDCYLTSSEANVRNLQLGIKAAKELGVNKYIGYFPDTFGFPLQTVQLYKQAGIDTLVFGRGVFTSKESNLNKSQTNFSELLLEAPNGEQILAILLSNWYNNGLEIPTDKVQAKEYWDKKLTESRNDASTRHLLFMNGSDHQPLQKDISEAIAVANELYDDIEFVHTSLENYIEEMKSELDYSKLSVLDEEIKQQYTDGMYYLTGTASSRVKTKQFNFEVQNMLEKQLEPLQMITAMTDIGKNEYIWKLLLQNHAHDSICGCSIDDVNHSVIERFKSVKGAAVEQLRNISYKISSQLPSKNNSFSLTNSSLVDSRKYIEVFVNYNKQEFVDSNIDKIRTEILNQVEAGYVLSSDGEKIEAIIEDLGIANTYELPISKFRRSMLCRKLKVSFIATVPAGSSKVYNLELIDSVEKNWTTDRIIENKYYQVAVGEDFNVLNKATSKTIKKFIEFVDCGDIGNTFMFGNVEEDQPIKLDFSNAIISTTKNSEFEQMIIKTNLMLPVSAEISKIEEERNSFTYIENRIATRAEQMVNNPIEIKVTLTKSSRDIDFKVCFTNKSQDHRLRAIFNTCEQFESVNAGTIFEQVTRKPIVNHGYKLSNNQHQFEKVLQVDTKQLTYTVTTKGLYEYEAEKSNKLGITLLRSVGEMGDWLYFPTPKAQLLGKHTFDFAITLSNHTKKSEVLCNAYNYYDELHMIELTENNPAVPKATYFDKLNNHDVIVTSLKSGTGDSAIIRGYALKDTILEYYGKNITQLDILEKQIAIPQKAIQLRKNQIFTIEVDNFIK